MEMFCRFFGFGHTLIYFTLYFPLSLSTGRFLFHSSFSQNLRSGTSQPAFFYAVSQWRTNKTIQPALIISVIACRLYYSNKGLHRITGQHHKPYRPLGKVKGNLKPNILPSRFSFYLSGEKNFFYITSIHGGGPRTYLYFRTKYSRKKFEKS